MIFEQLFDTKSSTYTYVISSGEGREALIIDPFESSKDVLLSIMMSEILIHSGRFFIAILTFFTRFVAVLSFVAKMRMFFSLWNNINHTQ